MARSRDLTPAQQRRVRFAYAWMALLFVAATSFALFQPFGHYSAIYLILGYAAIAIPLHVVLVGRSIRTSNRRARQARLEREQRTSTD